MIPKETKYNLHYGKSFQNFKHSSDAWPEYSTIALSWIKALKALVGR